MAAVAKEALKRFLGEIPFTAELYYLVRQGGKPFSRFSLRHLQAFGPEMAAQAAALRKPTPQGKKIFFFATLHYWIERAAVLSTALAAQGHTVTLGYLPYGDWINPINRFDLRRQNVYSRRILSALSPLVETVSFLSQRPNIRPLPEAVEEIVRQISNYDAQYTQQVEEVDPESEVYQLRLERNRAVAAVAYHYLRANPPQQVIVPNGTIQELAVVYRIARHLKIPTVTYEFGDQRQRIWLAQNSEVMRQETDALWQARKDLPLNEEQLERMKSLFMARQRATLWENFARQWQGTPAQGGGKIRAELKLDDRPVVLLATNVLGDSLTLGRQVFSRSMAEWISRTVQYFMERTDIQLVIRVHPGEVLTHGQSMADVVRQVLPKLPAHIHLIGPKEKVNTYDIIEVADLGLVYTTTVGMEMAMSGVPVIVAGQTHYRGRGFTIDPDSYVNYFKTLGLMLEDIPSHRLSRKQVEMAWSYAYRFFFEYPRPFPWHLVRLAEDYKARPMEQVLSEEGLQQYGQTLRYLAGEPIDWEHVE